MKKGVDYSSLEKKFRLKYVLDRCIAAMLIILTFPIFFAATVLIKIDGWLHPENAGYLFYTEPRISAGKVFNIIKFRTVTTKTVKWVREDMENRSITGCRDVTWAGRIILNWYMDELPQIINILRGEMTFIGPRPHILAQSRQEINKLGLTYRRHIKAGLLGVVQAWKCDKKYKDLFEKMAKTHNSHFEALNKLDALYADKCMEKNPVEIMFFDIHLMLRGILTVLKGMENRRCY